MLLSKPTLNNMASKFGMGLLFLLTSNLSMALMWESDNAKGSSITLYIRTSVLSRIQAKTTRARRNANLLKKTRRNRRRRFFDSCVSGRSTFSDTDYDNLRLVQERQRTKSKVFPRSVQNFLQWIRNSRKRSAFYCQTGNVQL